MEETVSLASPSLVVVRHYQADEIGNTCGKSLNGLCSVCYGKIGEEQPSTPSWRWFVVLRRGCLQEVLPELGLRATGASLEVGEDDTGFPERS